MRKTKIGIDFGGVIIPIINFRSKNDTSFIECENNSSLQTPENKNAIVSIHALVKNYDKKNIFIISKAGLKTQDRTVNWLNNNNFFQRTGFAKENILFCDEREEKGILCKKLGIIHFIDDRIHIMQILREIVPNLYLFGENEKNKNVTKWVTLVENWDELLPYLLQTH